MSSLIFALSFVETWTQRYSDYFLYQKGVNKLRVVEVASLEVEVGMWLLLLLCVEFEKFPTFRFRYTRRDYREYSRNRARPVCIHFTDQRWGKRLQKQGIWTYPYPACGRLPSTVKTGCWRQARPHGRRISPYALVLLKPLLSSLPAPPCLLLLYSL